MTEDDNERVPLGEYLRLVREEAGLSVRELGRLTQANHAYLGRLEKGERGEPSADLLQRIADVLKIDASELLSYIGVKPVLPEPRAYFRRKLGVNAEEADVLAHLIEEYQEKRKEGNREDTN
jgi:transcriptional regulator with XRE-family HTH domain